MLRFNFVGLFAVSVPATESSHLSLLCRFKDVRIGEPSMPRDGVSEEINPQMCRLSDMTYGPFAHFMFIYFSF